MVLYQGLKMKPSYTQTPRMMSEATWTTGAYSVSYKKSRLSVIGGYVLAFAIGAGMAALLVAWWSV
jgi:hypothetical protein